MRLVEGEGGGSEGGSDGCSDSVVMIWVGSGSGDKLFFALFV